MNIKVIKNEKIKNTNRARDIHFIEINVNKIENIDEKLAEKFLEDIILQNTHLDFTLETWNDIKNIIEDKLEKAIKYSKGYLKNDGTIIPLIANYVIEKVFNIELLTYSENLDDIQNPPKGFDAMFLDNDLSIFLCEYKSSITKLNEEEISNKLISGYKSVFCTDSAVISKISAIKTRIEIEEKKNKELIKRNLNKIKENRKKLEEITNDKCATFNLCCITKSSSKLSLELITDNINKKFKKGIYCINNRHKKCEKYDTCQKIEKIKVIKIIVIKIPEDFKIEMFYKNIIKKIEEKINE